MAENQQAQRAVGTKTKTFYLYLAIKENYAIGSEGVRLRCAALRQAITQVTQNPHQYLVLKNGANMQGARRDRMEICVGQNEAGQPCAAMIYYTLARGDRNFDFTQLKSDLMALLGVPTLYWESRSDTKTDTNMTEFATSKKMLL